jgi:hypothetical protein
MKEAIEQKEKNHRYKLEIYNRLGQEYQKEEDEKKQRESKERDMQRQPYETSLDHKYDRNVNSFRNRIVNLSDKVDNNSNNYLKYKENHNIYNEENRIQNFQEKCYNNMKVLKNENLNNNLQSNGYGQIENNNKTYLPETNDNSQNLGNSDLNKELELEKYKIENLKESKLIDECNRNEINEFIKQSQKQNYNFNNSIRQQNLSDHVLQEASNNCNELERLRERTPSYKQHYAFNPQKQYNEMDQSSLLKKNIISLNTNNLERLQQYNDVYKKNHQALNKSVLDYNMEQINFKRRVKDMEEQNKKQLLEERLKEGQRLKRENMEKNIIKNNNINNYRQILDNQCSYGGNNLNHSQFNPNINNPNSQNINNSNLASDLPNRNYYCEQDNFKFYVTPKTYSLGGTSLDHNPILNPVNSYKFARYYLQKNQNSLSQYLPGTAK